MSIILRDYQVDIINRARALMQQGVRRILIVAPTGSGKTALTAHMLATAANKSMASYFMVHRRELIKQSVKTFDRVDVYHGVVAASFPEDPNPFVQIASIPTLVNRLDKMPRRPRLIIWDECHHIAAGTWAKIFKAFPDAYHIGLTATPQRLDGKGLGDYFDRIVLGPKVSWLIENKFLSAYEAYAPPGINTQGLHTRMGEFIKSELEAVANKPTITGSAIKEYLNHLHGKPAIVFAATIKHSMNIVDQARMKGIRAQHVDGETDAYERDKAIDLFSQGKLDWLSNVGLFGEGFDVPSVCGVVDLAPTNSLGSYLQRFGRCLRPCEGKEVAIYLDHAGNIERHGLPDEERNWTLEGTNIGQGKGKKAEPSIRICPKCFAAQKSGSSSCLYCSHEFEVKSRKIEQADGPLSKITKEELAERREKKKQRFAQIQAESLKDLIELGKKRGYKKPEKWATYIYQARQVKKLKEGRNR